MKKTTANLVFYIVAATLSLLPRAGSAEPIPVIFDTDITGDVDDALALAMLHTLSDRGLCEIKAVTISKKNELAAPFVDALNTFYGRPDIPIGIDPEAPERDSKYLKVVTEKSGDKFRYPHDIGVSKEPELALDLLKKTLAAAKDKSVVIIQVGLATNIAQLLNDKEGMALIEQKVDHLSVMAGAFETIAGNNRYCEANIRNHVPSMQTLAEKWPVTVPVIWSGFEIGIAAPYPRKSIKGDFEMVDHHIIKEAYLLHTGPEHDRPTWDLTSVLYSIFPDRGYFDLSPPGRVEVRDDGSTRFRPAQGARDFPKNTDKMQAEKKRDRYLTMTAEQASRVQEALVQFVAKPPATFPTPKDAPVSFIFDTDMGNDVDDAMALAMIHALERRGACKLLAVTSTKDHEKSAAYIDALNTFYGNGDVPIGAVRNGVTPEYGKYLPLAENYPHDLKSGADAEDALVLLRKTLASQPDNSVSIAQVGFFTNLARLLDTEGDDISPLNGVELVKKKVKQLVIMAGAFQTIRYDNGYCEYNVFKDVPSAQHFTEKWPSPIIWSGFEIGISAAYPWESVMKDYDYITPHIIKESYLDYAPRKPHDRPTWDLTAVLHAVYPDRGYFTLSPRGRVTIEENGFSTFTPSRKPGVGRDRYLVMNKIKAAKVREALVQLTSEPPKK
ncbi:MAG: nucleoside hydrolase [Verrucomicrobiales bacterium]|nr:nucleoside hydrolase [Verrucomicrobiales bacterium]